MKFPYGFLLFLPLIFFAGCSEDKTKGNSYVGNMSDTTYAGQITPSHTKFRVNAVGDEIAINQFEGKFVWADLAAPWCSACIPQTQALKRLESSYQDKVAFVTVMTSNSPKPNDPVNEKTARKWAQSFGLAPANVLAATDLRGRTVPAHYFYSPKGQTLYHHIGGLSESQIRDALNKYIYEWEQWDEYGTRADWMRD